MASIPEPAARLDLRGTPCPLNFIRARLALETITPGDWLQVDLDAGEPQRMVAEGLAADGHRVEAVQPARPEFPAAVVRLLIRRHGS